MSNTDHNRRRRPQYSPGAQIGDEDHIVFEIQALPGSFDFLLLMPFVLSLSMDIETPLVISLVI